MEYLVKVKTTKVISETELEDKVISKITAKIYKDLDIGKKVKTFFDKTFEESLQMKVNEQLNDLLNKTLTEEISITDTWGRETFKGTIKDKIIQSFQKFMNENVDKDMRPYQSGNPRIVMITKQIIDNECSKFTQDVTSTLNKAVKEKLSESLKLAVGNEIVNSIGVKNVIDHLQLEVKKK